MNSNPKMDVIVLAADRGPGDPLALAAGVKSKSLVPAGGVPMLERVVRALEGSRYIGRILIVHTIDELPTALPMLGPWLRSGKVMLTAAQSSPSLSVLHGIETLGRQFPVIVTTSDHALLRTEMVDHFCGRAAISGADICAGLTAASDIRQAYPDTRRTYLRFRGGAYSGSNLFAVVSPLGIAAVELWRQVEQQRKRPWRIARVFGWGLLIGYLLRLWRVDDAIAKAGRRIGVVAAAIKMPFAEAAIDVDTLADLELVEKILAPARRD